MDAPRTKNALPPPSPRVQFHLIGRMRSHGQRGKPVTLKHFTSSRRVGATENAGVENAKRTKMQRWKMQFPPCYLLPHFHSCIFHRPPLSAPPTRYTHYIHSTAYYSYKMATATTTD